MEELFGDKTSARRAGRYISHLLAKFFLSSDENRSYPPRKLFSTPCCWYLKINIFYFFHIQGLHIFASTLSDFCRSIRAACTADFLFHWHWYLIHLTHLRWHAVLLSLIFIAFRFLDSLMSHGRSKYVIGMGQFEPASFDKIKKWISQISSMKIDIMLPVNHLRHPVICLEI
jgi:hypothetical protein